MTRYHRGRVHSLTIPGPISVKNPLEKLLTPVSGEGQRPNSRDPRILGSFLCFSSVSL